LNLWGKYGSYCERFRKEFNYSRFMVEAEYLYYRIREYGKKHPELKISIPTETTPQ
jgi:hypothetical protein